MVTRPCKLQEKDYDSISKKIDEYFSEREAKQEVLLLKNGDKRVYREPPSKYRLCKKLGIDTDTFDRYVNKEYTEDRESYSEKICGLLMDAKQRIIEELTEGVLLGYWNDRVASAMLAKFGVIGPVEDTKEVKIVMQCKEAWSE